MPAGVRGSTMVKSTLVPVASTTTTPRTKRKASIAVLSADGCHEPFQLLDDVWPGRLVDDPRHASRFELLDAAAQFLRLPRERKRGQQRRRFSHGGQVPIVDPHQMVLVDGQMTLRLGNPFYRLSPAGPARRTV